MRVIVWDSRPEGNHSKIIVQEVFLLGGIS